MKYKPVILIIIDGWGLAPPGPGNAISLAKLSNINRLWQAFPHTQLLASQEAVGLPHGEEGNSEVGHLNIGAGYIVYQDLPRINMSIADGSFLKNPAFLKAAHHLKKNKSRLHLLGLIGPGAVHSSIEHLYALLWFCKEQKIKEVYLHLFTDGRDAPPTSSSNYLRQIEEKLKNLKIGEIATVTGRYWAMDRDNRWKRIQKAYEALTEGIGEKVYSSLEAVQKSYDQKRTDEFVLPSIIMKKNQPVAVIENNDAVIFFNFRPDRSRELTKAFILPNFENLKDNRKIFDPYKEKYGRFQNHPSPISTFQRKKILKNISFVTMTEYEKGLPVEVAFSPILVALPLARIISERGLRQLHISETEKYPHVTFFINGGREKPFVAEDRLEIASPKVSTYDLQPEMSAYQLTKLLLDKISQRIYDFIIVNYANADMVGHTGVIKAGIKSCEVVDECLGKVVRSVLSQNGACIITADHGNVEEMINLSTGEVDTEHSLNPVPFIIINQQLRGKNQELPRGILADIAHTILNLMEISKPGIMTGRNLLSPY